MFHDFAGKTIYKRLTDAEVVAGRLPWFRSEIMLVSTRDVQTDNGTPDSVDIILSFEFDELVRYAFADTEAFALLD